MNRNNSKSSSEEYSSSSSPEGLPEKGSDEAKHLPPNQTSQGTTNDDVFFASGPFYAHLDDLEDDDEEDEELAVSLSLFSCFLVAAFISHTNFAPLSLYRIQSQIDLRG